MPVLDGFSAQKRIQASPLAGDPCIVALTANVDQVSRPQKMKLTVQDTKFEVH